MLYGEHLSADDVAVKCPCGESATVEVIDRYQCSRGWFCRRCSHRARKELRKQEKIAREIVRSLR